MSILAISGKINSGKDTVAKMIQFFDAVDKAKAKGIRKTYSFEEYNKYNLLGISTWEINKWADSIKDTVCSWIGCTREQLEDREFKEKPLGEEWDKWGVFRNKKEKYKYFSTKEEATEYFRADPDYRRSPKYIQMTPRKLMQLLGTEAGREIIHPNIWVNALMSDYEGKEVRTGIGDNFYVEYPDWIISDTRFPNEAKAVRDRDGVLIRINRPTPDNKTLSSHPSETALDNWKDWDYIIENDGSLEDLLIKVKQIYKEITNE